MPAQQDIENTSTDSENGNEKTLSFEDDQSLNPQNWPQTRKILILTSAYLLVANGTIGTSLASGGVDSTIKEFGLSNSYGWRVLPVSIYLVGYCIGNTVLAPWSEMYGRRPINLVTSFMFMIWMMAGALAPNWAALNIFRLINGFFAAGPPSTVSGICADLYGNGIRRGRALLGYNMVTTFGSVIGPIISGFAVMYSWRLSFWIGMGIGGICFLCVLLAMPETNAKVLLDKTARKIRQDHDSTTPHGPSDNDKLTMRDFLSKVLFRPLTMLAREPLVLFSCLYLAFQYSLLYIFLQSYPIIFEDTYNLNTGEEGLMFIGLGIGVLLSLPLNLTFERYYLSACARDRPWTKHHGAQRLPPACASGPLIAVGLFWSAWTSRPSVHWISAALSGIPYGIGYTLNFNSLLNYLVDGYASYASSANAASSVTRQLMGAALPFAATPMFRTLGIAWANSLLGFVAAAFSIIPFGFWFYGEKLLEKSKWAQELAKERDES